ncbi:hypothetical protein J437_LFUL003093 [Ladona fulva]|uniref:Uncharacterized protein n=1 Tax=Ladona fulva TaxID=123851 RepID=A0A8K0JY21_LADFU|nr:hypothetical protein J437_LFUL003093 [Ladona fulva]
MSERSLYLTTAFFTFFLLSLVSRNSRGCYVFPPGSGGDPCISKSCPPGARCVPSPDGRTATCECPERCPVYGDHVGAGPICGDDAKDYPSLCHLRKAACSAGVNIALKFHGKCGEYSYTSSERSSRDASFRRSRFPTSHIDTFMASLTLEKEALFGIINPLSGKWLRRCVDKEYPKELDGQKL